MSVTKDLASAADLVHSNSAKLVLLETGGVSRYYLAGPGSTPEDDDDSGGSTCGVVCEDATLYNASLMKRLEDDAGIAAKTAVPSVDMHSALREALLQCGTIDYSARYETLVSGGVLSDVVLGWLEALGCDDMLLVTSLLMHILPKTHAQALLARLEEARNEESLMDAGSATDRNHQYKADSVYSEPTMYRLTSDQSTMSDSLSTDDGGDGDGAMVSDEAIVQMLRVKPGRMVEWQAEFDALVLRSQRDPSNEGKLIDLGNLVSDFTRAASMYSRVIISEYGLARRAKSIRPASMGGVAGGDKYVAGGIFFKFSIDRDGLYGSNYLASKAARHDLRYLSLLFGEKPTDLGIPLTCLVQYKGMSVLAQALLPGLHGSKTLVYGSCDGGNTVMNTSERGQEIMEGIGEALNLQPHLCNGVTMAMCGDIELHQTTNGQFFVLDAARLMPPEPLVNTPKIIRGSDETGPKTDVALASVLTRHLRSELVSKNPAPLCSDAYTLFDSDPEQREQNKAALSQCFTFLLETVIPKFVATIEPGNPLETDLTQRMHVAGINVRHLNRVYDCMNDECWRSICLAEIAARSLKELFRGIYTVLSERLMGSVAVERPYVQCFIQFVNELAAPTSGTGQLLWKQAALVARGKFRSGQATNLVDMKNRLHWGIFVKRLLSMSGMECEMASLQSLFAQPTLDSRTRIEGVLHDGNLDGLRADINALSVMDLTLGIKSFRQATLTTSPTLRLHHLHDSLRMLQSSVGSTTGVHSLYLPQVYFQIIIALRNAGMVTDLAARGVFMVSHALEIMDSFVAAKARDSPGEAVASFRQERRRSSALLGGAHHKGTGLVELAQKGSGTGIGARYGAAASAVVPSHIWPELCNLMFAVFTAMHAPHESSSRVILRSNLPETFSHERLRSILDHLPTHGAGLVPALTIPLSMYWRRKLVAEFILNETAVWELNTPSDNRAASARRMLGIVTELAANESWALVAATSARTALMFQSVGCSLVFSKGAHATDHTEKLKEVCRVLRGPDEWPEWDGSDEDAFLQMPFGSVEDWRDVLPVIMMPLFAFAADIPGAQGAIERLSMITHNRIRLTTTPPIVAGMACAAQYYVLNEVYGELPVLQKHLTRAAGSGDEYAARAATLLATFIGLCNGVVGAGEALDRIISSAPDAPSDPCYLGWLVLVPRVHRTMTNVDDLAYQGGEGVDSILTRVSQAASWDRGVWGWEFDVDVGVFEVCRALATSQEVAELASIHDPRVDGILGPLVIALERIATSKECAEAAGVILVAAKLQWLHAHGLEIVLLVLANALRCTIAQEGAAGPAHFESALESLEHALQASGVDTADVRMSTFGASTKMVTQAASVRELIRENAARAEVLRSLCIVDSTVSTADYDRVAGLTRGYGSRAYVRSALFPDEEGATEEPTACLDRAALLSDIIKTSPNGMRTEEFLRLALRMVEALGTKYHSRNLVHLCLSPAAITVSGDAGSEDVAIRSSPFHVLAGSSDAPDVISFKYCSPELIMRKQMTHEADMYLLGICFYEMLTGAHPFAGMVKISDLTNAHLHAPVPSLSERRPELPRDLIRVVESLLSKDPSDRYRSAFALHRALSLVARGPGGGAEDMAVLTPISSPDYTINARHLLCRDLFSQFTEHLLRESSRMAAIITGPEGSGKIKLTSSVLEEAPQAASVGNDFDLVLVRGRFEPAATTPGEDLTTALLEAIVSAGPDVVERIRSQADSEVAALRPDLLKDVTGILAGVAVEEPPLLSGDALQSRNMLAIAHILRVLSTMDNTRVVVHMTGAESMDICTAQALGRAGAIGDSSLAVFLEGLRPPLPNRVESMRGGFEGESFVQHDLKDLEVPEAAAFLARIFGETDAGAMTPLADAIVSMNGGLPGEVLEAARLLHQHRKIVFSFETGMFECPDAITHLRQISTGNPMVIRGRLEDVTPVHPSALLLLSILDRVACPLSTEDFVTIVRAENESGSISPFSPSGVRNAVEGLCSGGLLVQSNNAFWFAHRLVRDESRTLMNAAVRDGSRLVTGLLNVCYRVGPKDPLVAWGDWALDQAHHGTVLRFGEIVIDLMCTGDTAKSLLDPKCLGVLVSILRVVYSEASQKQRHDQEYRVVSCVMSALYRVHEGRREALLDGTDGDDGANCLVERLDSAERLWQSADPGFLLDILIQFTVAMFCTKKRDMAEGVAKMLLRRFRNKRETIRIFQMFLEQLSFTHAYSSVLKYTSEFMERALGVSIPESPRPEMVGGMVKSVIGYLKGLPSLASLSKLEVCTDADAALLTDTLVEAMPAALGVQNKGFFACCMCKAVLNTFENGLTPSGVVAMSFLAFSHHKMINDLALVRPLVKAVMALLDDPRLQITAGKRLQALHCLAKVGHLAHDDRTVSLRQFGEAHRLALTHGNHTYATRAGAEYMWDLLVAGSGLRKCKEWSASYVTLTSTLGDGLFNRLGSLMVYGIERLTQGEVDDSETLEGIVIELLTPPNNVSVTPVVAFFTGLAFPAYFREEYSRIVDCYSTYLPTPVLEGAWMCRPYYELHLFVGLACVEVLRSLKSDPDTTESGGTERVQATLDQCVGRLQTWAEANPAVYGARLSLMRGEVHRLEGRLHDAIREFSNCRAQCAELEALYIALISAERTADAYIELGLTEAAGGALSLALKISECWGGGHKSVLLQRKLQQLHHRTDSGKELSELLRRLYHRNKRHSVVLAGHPLATAE